MTVGNGDVRVVGEHLEVSKDIFDIGSNAPLGEAVSGTNIKTRIGSESRTEK